MLEIAGVVTTVTSGALEDGVIVGVDVAGGAYAVGVPVRGRERGVLRVIERRSGPGRRGVTVLARSREELGLRAVPRVRGVVVIGLMAADTCGGQRGVVAVHMAVGALAWRYGVRSRQRERCVVVIKGRVGPGGGVVAQLARGRESRARVRRIRRARVILLVARVAQRTVQVVVAVHVAIDALSRRHRVRSGQGESGAGVIELAIGP